MLTSKVNITDLVNIDEVNLMKMIFSSGDYFPGFYRYTLGTQKVGDESLGLSTLIWLYFEEKLSGKKHHKEDWLELQHEIYDRDISSNEARNFGNFPHVRDLISDRMMDWYFKASGFDIIYLDTENKISSFEKDKTYYFMGSLICYSEGKLKIGYNQLENESVEELEIEFEIVQNYLNSIFSKEDYSNLFLYADIIGELKFIDDFGRLKMDEKVIDQLLVKNSEMKVFAAPIESRHLPMRFAKSIRLTNFKRGDDGTFEVWKSDQNW
jgi:hypothetical protein